MATITTEKPRIAEIPTGVEIDPVTLDIIEGRSRAPATRWTRCSSAPR